MGLGLVDNHSNWIQLNIQTRKIIQAYSSGLLLKDISTQALLVISWPNPLNLSEFMDWINERVLEINGKHLLPPGTRSPPRQAMHESTRRRNARPFSKDWRPHAPSFVTNCGFTLRVFDCVWARVIWDTSANFQGTAANLSKLVCDLDLSHASAIFGSQSDEAPTATIGRLPQTGWCSANWLASGHTNGEELAFSRQYSTITLPLTPYCLRSL